MKHNDYPDQISYLSQPIIFSFGEYCHEPLLWRVLASNNDAVLAIADQDIDLRRVDADPDPSRSSSFPMDWLNSFFINEVFFPSEQRQIVDVEADCSDNGTTVKMWLLSERDANALFNSYMERRIFHNGDISMRAGLRPAMWIKKSLIPESSRQLFSNDCRFFVRERINRETMTFGCYKDNYLSWSVLDQKQGKQLLLCNSIIEYLPFHDKYEGVKWEECTLRTWLNEEFFNLAFNKWEQYRIIERTEKISDNITVSDKVWLLSAEEAHHYFDNNLIELSGPAQYLSPDWSESYLCRGKCQRWFLRTNAAEGHNMWEASNVEDYAPCEHRVNDGGRNWNVNISAGIRPAIWVECPSAYEREEDNISFSIKTERHYSNFFLRTLKRKQDKPEP